MLVRLKVQNFALIKDLDLQPDNGLNIITGETGAGKSILIGALGLILGERADAKTLLSHTDKCVVEGHFDIKAYGLESFFADNDLDYDPLTIIRREILENGKSRAFINDTPAQLTLLRDLGLRLVDIHSQHQTLQLNDKAFQLQVVDLLAGNRSLLADFRQAYKDAKATRERLEQLREQDRNARKDQDYLQFQYDELAAANLDENEQQQLEQEAEVLENAGEIQQACSQAIQTLSDGDQPIVDGLNTVKGLIQQAARHHHALQPLLQRLDSCIIELKDIAAELEDTVQQVQGNPDRLETVNGRLNLIYNLHKKHRVTSNSELIQLTEQLAQQLQQISHLDEAIQELEQLLTTQDKQMLNLAGQLSAQRQAAFEPLEKAVNSLLSEVGMPHASIKVQHQVLTDSQVTPSGIDELQLLFATNPGSPFLPISKIASGGEAVTVNAEH